MMMMMIMRVRSLREYPAWRRRMPVFLQDLNIGRVSRNITRCYQPLSLWYAIFPPQQPPGWDPTYIDRCLAKLAVIGGNLSQEPCWLVLTIGSFHDRDMDSLVLDVASKYRHEGHISIRYDK